MKNGSVKKIRIIAMICITVILALAITNVQADTGPNVLTEGVSNKSNNSAELSGYVYTNGGKVIT